MRTIEQQGYALQNLLHLAEKSPVQLTYRGVDDRDRSLFELKTRNGEMVCQQANEKELVKLLNKGGAGVQA